MLLIKMSSVFFYKKKKKRDNVFFLATQSTDVEYLRRQLIIMLMANLDTVNELNWKKNVVNNQSYATVYVWTDFTAILQPWKWVLIDD